MARAFAWIKSDPVSYNTSYQDSRALFPWDSPPRIPESPLLRCLRIFPRQAMYHHTPKKGREERGGERRKAHLQRRPRSQRGSS